MRAGGRPCFLAIYRPGNAEFAGEANAAPVLDREVCGSLIPVRAREVEPNGERQSLVTYQARLDYLDGLGITDTMIVRYEGAEYGIVGVLVDHSTKKTVDLQLSEQKHGA